jgi:putative ABC transport system permease protein
LIGSEIVERLFKNVEPVGQIIFVTRGDNLAYPCRVQGVLRPQSSNKEWRKPNLEIHLPYTYFQQVNSDWNNEMHDFIAQLYPGTDIERTGLGIRRYFEQKYGKSGNFRVDNDSLLLAQMKKFLGLFAVMLSAIALITLGVGGMGINNMMLVSISERFKEIGLRKAVGATDRSIRIQFLFESVFLSTIAGMMGVALGFSGYEMIIFVASKFVSKLNFEWVMEPVALVLSLVSILVVGLASGIVPAVKAERLQVIEALRSE